MPMPLRPFLAGLALACALPCLAQSPATIVNKTDRNLRVGILDLGGTKGRYKYPDDTRWEDFNTVFKPLVKKDTAFAIALTAGDKVFKVWQANSEPPNASWLFRDKGPEGSPRWECDTFFKDAFTVEIKGETITIKNK